MTEHRADLHIHTNFSDSTRSPEEVVALAHKDGLAAISIADHDTVEAIAAAMDAAAPLGLEVIPGVELSSEVNGKDIHILGYFFDMDSPLIGELRGMRDARVDRMKKMIAKLEHLGIRDITYEEIAAQTESDAVGRPHLAQMLLDKGHVKDMNEAFTRYLGEGAAAYYPKYKQTPYEAIGLIKRSGGLAVMAHPMLTRRDELIPSLVEAGLDGLECYYPNCAPETTEFYLRLVKKYGLLVTGGSDDHGEKKDTTYIGKAYVTYDHIERMKERL